MATDTSDVDQASHAEYGGYAAMKAAWASQRPALLAARDALIAAKGAGLNPSGAVELLRLIEAIDRNDAIYR